MASVFLSYARADVATAENIAAKLEAAGHDVWWDRHLRGGSQYSKQIEEALERAEAVVVLWSRCSVDSAWVRDEAAAARDSGRLIPLSIDGTGAPLGFRQFHTIDVTNSRESGLQSVLNAIAETGGERWVTGSTAAAESSGLSKQRVSRRTVVAGLAATGVGLAGFAGYSLFEKDQRALTPEVQSLLDQAWQAWTQGSKDGNIQAIGLYRRAVELDPNFADGWGLLACAYADLGHWFVPVRERESVWARAREAARRAIELDPKNAIARATLAYVQPILGNWWSMEQAYRAALADQPGKPLVLYMLALVLMMVGRVGEAADIWDGIANSSPTANQYRWHIRALWAASRLSRAEDMLSQASAIYARNPWIWLLDYEMKLHGGQPGAALALARQDIPEGFSDGEKQAFVSIADAVASGVDRQDPAIVASEVKRAQEDPLQAMNVVGNLCALDRIDQAFAVADAIYFSRGFAIPDGKESPDAPKTFTIDNRSTVWMFQPSARAMWTDPRFRALADAIGLSAYWRASKSIPDIFRETA